MNEDQIQQLITKYLNGTATAEEREQVLLWYRENSDQIAEWTVEQEDERQQIKGRVLANLHRYIREKENKNRRFISGRWLAAASLLFICTLAFLYRNKIGNLLNPVKQQYAVTQYGEHKLITLSDSTKVWLSGGSKLQYPNHFTGGTREISFSGEAFFDVAKDKAHPFIIHTDDISTKVLGTTFNLSAYKEQKEITVVLLTGKVAFSEGKKDVTILPNQQAVYNKESDKLSKGDDPDAQNMLARRNGNYIYENVSLSEITDDLRRNYNLHININGAVGNCLFYGRLKAGESPDKFLKRMCRIMNAQLSKTGETYTITGGGCMN